MTSGHDHEQVRTGSPPSSVRREVTLPVPPEEAWDAIVRPEGWLADDVELDPWEGGALRAAWEDGAERLGEVLEIEEPRRMRFRWAGTEDESEVVLTLDAVAAGTRVVVVETPAAAGWGPRLQALAAAPRALCPA